MRTANALAIDANRVSTRRGRWRGRTFAENFWANVDQGGECWFWRGKLNTKGYGSVGVAKGHTELAHRVAFVLAHGPLEAGELALHRPECSSRSCCRPSHIYRGTQLENVADARAAGRHVSVTGNQWVVRLGVRRDERGRILGRASL
jgi:hypothetical protein